MTTKVLSSDITSYDLLKTFAVITMIIDHIGIYFFPDDMWWRAVGRFSAPVWMFLIGYAMSRDIPQRLWVGALVLIAASAFVAPTFFPFNILVGIIIVRLIIDRVAGFMFKSLERMIAGMALVLVAFLPTYLLFDYGSLVLVMALFGYAMRHRGSLPLLTSQGIVLFGFASASLHILGAYLGFDFVGLQTYAMAAGVFGVYVMLYHFKPTTFPEASKKLPGFAVSFLHVCGRRTLEIYVGHLILFKIMAFALGIQGFGLFEWKLY